MFHPPGRRDTFFTWNASPTRPVAIELAKTACRKARRPRGATLADSAVAKAAEETTGATNITGL
jgi:hypothetical protein